ncbi:hypothetical protein FTUN_7989 [Frigoriglobus tundricola]|uniref:Uncharacterized protein n=1 Tax=Frigoriglobus tundricola TaxID=2774151 RepID=A0A6M5Z1U6_9BACT|nr:hypothetical protein FTUN_7989 [Frigoriglobus tundricola]
MGRVCITARLTKNDRVLHPVAVVALRTDPTKRVPTQLVLAHVVRVAGALLRMVSCMAPVKR